MAGSALYCRSFHSAGTHTLAWSCNTKNSRINVSEVPVYSGRSPSEFAYQGPRFSAAMRHPNRGYVVVQANTLTVFTARVLNLAVGYSRTGIGCNLLFMLLATIAHRMHGKLPSRLLLSDCVTSASRAMHPLSELYVAANLESWA